MLRNLEGPLLGPTMHVAERIYGRSPDGLARFAPQGSGAVFRDAGHLEVDPPRGALPAPLEGGGAASKACALR